MLKKLVNIVSVHNYSLINECTLCYCVMCYFIISFRTEEELLKIDNILRKLQGWVKEKEP